MTSKIIGIGLFISLFNPSKIVEIPKEITEKIEIIEDSLNLSNLFSYIKQKKIKFCNVVLKQSIWETGWLKSRVCRENNNLFGMKLARQRKTTAAGERNGYAKYANWKSSVDDYAIWQSRFNLSKVRDYANFLMKRGYCEDKQYARFMNIKIDTNSLSN